VRNISNELSIRTKIDAMSSGLKELAEKEGYWNPDEGDFDFAKAFSAGPVEELCKAGEKPCGRYQCGRSLLEELSANSKFSSL
jgi:secernin